MTPTLVESDEFFDYHGIRSRMIARESLHGGVTVDLMSEGVNGTLQNIAEVAFCMDVDEAQHLVTTLCRYIRAKRASTREAISV